MCHLKKVSVFWKLVCFCPQVAIRVSDCYLCWGPWQSKYQTLDYCQKPLELVARYVFLFRYGNWWTPYGYACYIHCGGGNRSVCTVWPEICAYRLDYTSPWWTLRRKCACIKFWLMYNFCRNNFVFPLLCCHIAFNFNCILCVCVRACVRENYALVATLLREICALLFFKEIYGEVHMHKFLYSAS
jgi:hypothetical protein